MKLKPILSKQAPEPIGPYSQAILHQGLLFCSGQVGIDPTTGKLKADDVESQAQQMFENLSAVARAANTSLSNALKTTLFLKSMDDFAKVNRIYAEYFKMPFPARSTIAVAGLPLGALCEIEAVIAV